MRHRNAQFVIGAFEKLRKETVGFVISVRPHGTTRSPTGRIVLEFDIRVFVVNMRRTFEFY